MGLFAKPPTDIICQRCSRKYKGSEHGVPVCPECWRIVENVYRQLTSLEKLGTPRSKVYAKLKARFLLSPRAKIDRNANEEAKKTVEKFRALKGLNEEERGLLVDVDTLLYR